MTDALAWHKSTYSGNTNDACIEVANDTRTGIRVRDSKLTDSPVLALSPTAWTDFVGMARADG
ncbi:DUF397 domain-containing protein [Streptomyces sp. NPDC051567]|uniref:DUF397 domain-containing protein n=1 Tax=Streptomyces sp. NPDC051567 TaxID=3365660 RepID=UPI0037A4481A